MVIREQTKRVKGCCNPLTPIKNELETVKQIAVTAKSAADQSADLIDDCLQRTAQSEIDIDNLDKSVTDLQVDIGDITVDIYNLEERATADEVRIATNESNIVTHAQRLTALESSDSEHESEITALQSDIADIKPRLSTAESDIDSLESTVGAQSTALNDLRDRMNVAESDITEHDGEIATAQDNIAANASEISSVKTRVSTLEDKIPEAIKQVTVSQDTSTVYHDAVHISGTTERDALPVASKTQAGVMSAAVYTAFDDGIKSNTARIETLESGTTVYDITGSVGEFPTIGEITSAFNTKYPSVTLKEGIRAVDYAYAHIWQYGNSTWLALTEVTVALATNDSAGTVKGSTSDGQIYVETDGTMSLNGYDVLVAHDQTHDSKISALESKGSSQDSEISGIKTRLTTAESDIDGNTSEISGLKTRLTTAESGISANSSEITSVKSRVTAVETKNTSQDTEISGVKTRLTTAEGSISGNSSSISALQTRMQTAESDIDSCEGRLTTNEGNISTNAADITSLKGRMNTAESDITSAEGDISTLQTSVNECASGVSNALSQISGKQDKLVSGTSIKTVNGMSLLGSGNIQVSGGASYTAGNGISIDNNVISIKMYRKSGFAIALLDDETDILSGGGLQKQSEKISDTLYLFTDDGSNDNVTTLYYPFITSISNYRVLRESSNSVTSTLYYYYLAKNKDISKYVGNYTGTVEISYYSFISYGSNNGFQDYSMKSQIPVENGKITNSTSSIYMYGWGTPKGIIIFNIKLY
jgi:trimeric autotransporter adhesin